MDRSFKIRVPASVANLGPGFDTLGLALQLYLDIVVEPATNGIVIVPQGVDSTILPSSEENLIFKVMQIVFGKVGVTPQNFAVYANNHIPIEKGLGSSAAATVAGLMTANELTGRQLSNFDLFQLAAKIEGHADNAAAALFGGLTISFTGRDDLLKYRKIEIPSDLRIVVVIPELRLPTKESRTVLPKMVPHADAVFNAQKTALLIEALRYGDYNLLQEAMQDRLHQIYRKKLVPGFDEVVKAAIESKAHGVALSGAGPAIMAFCQDNGQSIARAMQEVFTQQGMNSQYHILEIDNHGVQIQPNERKRNYRGQAENPEKVNQINSSDC